MIAKVLKIFVQCPSVQKREKILLLLIPFIYFMPSLLLRLTLDISRQVGNKIGPQLSTKAIKFQFKALKFCDHLLFGVLSRQDIEKENQKEKNK